MNIKKLSGIIIIVLLLINPLYAGDTSLITNVEGRQTTSLNGKWKIIMDPMENGTHCKFFLDEKSTDKTKYISYSFDGEKSLMVPGDWNTQLQELLYYEGTIWYRKKFNYHLGKDKRLFLHFGAVNYKATIYVNGKEIGKHVGGYTPFNFEITKELLDGENSVVLNIDNKRNKEGIPGTVFDWWNFGGITRPVTLVETTKTFIRDYSIQLDKKEKNLIDGWVQLDGNNLNGEVNIEIPELKIKQAVKTDDYGRAMFSIKAKPECWSPENPKVYLVNISHESDKIIEKIGFRTIETRGKTILLNGKKIFLRGVNIHAQVYGRSAWSKEDAAMLLGWAKEMGCNFLRLAHYPHSEEMIRMAEEMGIMVWEEIPVYWDIEWGNTETYVNAEIQLDEMISRDKNRANVIIWSIANETRRCKERTEFLTKLANHAREQDPQRLISAALNGVENLDTFTRTVKDKLVDVLDVLSFNQYIGWFGGTPELCDKINWKFDIQKPLIMSEFGASAPFDRHGDKSEKYTVECQEYYYRKALGMIKQIPDLSGTCPWNLTEHRSPLRVMPGIEDGFSRAGLISINGQKKKAFYVMKKWYDELIENKK